MPAVAGSFWVQGTELRFVDAGGFVWRGTGVLVGANSNVKGSIWVEGTSIRYIGDDGNEYRLQEQNLGIAPGPAKKGSVWIQTSTPNSLLFINDTPDVIRWHSDIAHSDLAHSDSHGDSHSDSHGDSHSDTNQFTDNGFMDVIHLDSHSDTPHSDGHSDGHGDTGHQDVAHSDVPVQVTPAPP